MIDRYNTPRFLTFQEGIPILGESSDVNVVWDSEDDSPDADGLEELPEMAERIIAGQVRGRVIVDLGAYRECAPGLGDVVLIRTADGQFRAFDAICTHLDCTVQYQPDTSQIWCACHNGHFDLTGRNVQGPPPRPLDAYDVNVRGEEIVVSKRA